PGATAAAMGAVRRRAETPHDRQLFRIEGRHRDGRAIPLEVHGAPLWSAGRIVGRMGVCRVLDAAERADGAVAQTADRHPIQEERMRIARGLRDAIAQIVFGVAANGDASEAFLIDVKRATHADLARRLNLDEVDLAILPLV